MSKKIKNEKIDLLYINKNEKSNKNKTKRKNVPKKTIQKEDRINIDNEIIIGLTPKKKNKNPQNNKNNEKNKSRKNQIDKETKTNVKKKTTISKKKIRRLNVLKWTSIIILIMGIIVLFMLSPIFNIKQIEVDGINKLSKEEIISLSQMKLNENTFKIWKSNVIDKIKSNTYIETVKIERKLPSTVKIIVEEREPKYIIQIANGNVYIDSQGYILEISAQKIELPALLGYETPIDSIVDFQNTKKLLDEDCKKIEIVNHVIEAAKNNSILNYITSINISDINNIQLNLDGEKKRAYIGDASNANLRILYIKKMIEEEVGKEGEMFVNGDLTTLKPKPYFREKV